MTKEHNKTEQMIEELAQSVAAGFLGVDKQISELRSDMDAGFLGVDKQFKELRQEVFGKIDSEVGSLHSQMQTGFSSVHAELAVMRKEISDIKQGLEEVKHFAKSNDDAILDVVFGLEKRVKVLERKISMIAK